MKYLLLLFLFFAKVSAYASDSPCYWASSTIGKCFPLTGMYLDNGRALQLGNTSGNLVQIQTTSPSATWTWKLPPSSGTWGQYMQTDSTGTTSFATVPLQNNEVAPLSFISTTPQVAGTIKNQSVTVAYPYAYMAGGSTIGTIQAYNIANQKNPTLVGSITLAGSYGLCANSGNVFVPSSGASVLYVVNATNPAAMTITGQITISGSPGSLYSCAYSSGVVYLSTQNKGLTTVDVGGGGMGGTLAAPVQMYQEGGTLNKSFGIAIKGTTLYTTNFQVATPWTVRYLKTWDVTTPSAPALSATYTLPAGTKPLGVTVSGNLAYVTDANTNSIQVVDVTSAAAPNYLSSLFATNLFNSGFVAKVSGNYAYVPSGSNATYGGSIDVFDISVPATPVKVATTTMGVANSVFGGIDLQGGYIFVGDYGVAPGSAGGLDVFTAQWDSPNFGKTTVRSLTFSGSSPGAVTLAAPASAAATTLTFPGTAGSSGQALTTDGSGNLSWVSPTSGVTSVSGTAPVTVSPTTGAAVVSMAASTTSTNGYLTSTDWNTFNGKGSGTVTSVGLTSAGGIFSVSPAAVTTSGTFVEKVTGTSGGIPYFSAANTLSSSTSMTANGVIYGGGSGTSPSATNAGTTSQVFIGGTPPSFGNVPTAAIPASLANGTIGGYTPGAQAGATPSSPPSAGNVGENLSAYGTSVALNTTSFVSIAKVTLTAGLWSCMGVYWNNNSATQTGSTGKIFFENVNNGAFGLDEMTIAGGAATGGTVSFPTLFYIVKSGDADKSYDMEAKSTTAAGNAYGTVSCVRIN